MSQEHTVSSFDDELNQMRSKIVQMGNMVHGQFEKASLALADMNQDLADEIRAKDKEIDALEIEIEKFAIEMIALRSPVADDLREVISSIKISAALERIGDYAKNLAKRLTVLSNSNGVPSSTTLIQQMIIIVNTMINDVLDAYVTLDTDKAIDVWNRDQEVDSLYDSLFRELLTYMMEKPQTISAATHMLFIAKNVERAGDHATNIAEIIHYITEGEMLDVKRPKKDATSYADVDYDDVKS